MAGPAAPDRPVIPDTMWALELSGSGLGAVHLVERPTPRPGPGQALCRVEAASVCASDAKLVRLGGRHQNLSGWDPARRPIVPGHEGSLLVVEVGAAAGQRLRVGQRVVVAPNVPGPPRFDREHYGRPIEQVSRITVGFTLPGLLAQYVLLREDVLEAPGHVLPISSPPSVLSHFGAALAEPLSTVVAAHAAMVHLLRLPPDGERTYRAGVLPGGVTAVIGAGPMGLFHAAYSLLRQPRHLIVSEPNPARRSGLERFRDRALSERTRIQVVEPAALAGAVRAASGGRGADDVIITAGSAEVEAEALTLAAPGGCVSFFASNPPDDRLVRLDAGDLHYRSFMVSGTSGSDPLDLKRALELQEQGVIDLSPFVSAVGGIAAAPRALSGVVEGAFGGKVVIYPHAPSPELVPVLEWGPEAEARFLGQTFTQ